MPTIANLLVLRSADIHRAGRFYQALGLVSKLERHGSGPEHYSSCVNGFVLELYPVTDAAPTTKSTRIGFRVDSVDALIPLLVEVGASVLSPPHDSEWGRRAIVRDLDGHTVELLTTSGGIGEFDAEV